MSEHPSIPPGSLLGGKFRIDRLLGAGAMGTVYAIHHELTRHKRALKLLHPSVQNIPDVVRRFLNEASAAGRAGNPHIVETFDAGTLPTGEPYVVMELLEGETLGSVLTRAGGTLEPSLAAEFVAQAAEGIDAAHRAGIIHRDLKPENLFVTTRDGDPFIKIIDFGVSKFATGSASGVRGTQAGMMYGSPAYMSPEQLTGQVDVDARTDVFALGVVLFQCLAGTLPFDGPTIEALMVRILGGRPASFDSLGEGVPPALVDVVRAALELDRDVRIASASDLVRALEPFRPATLGGRDLRGAREDWALASTVGSNPPAPPASSPPDAQPRAGRVGRGAIALVAVAAMVLAAVGALFAARSVRTASIAPGAATAGSVAPPAATARAEVLSDRLTAPFEVAPSAAVRDRSPTIAAPPGTRRAVAAAAPAATSATAASIALPVAPSAGRPSAAQNLGLREDNPFR